MTISVKELLDALGGKLSEAAIRGLTGRLRDLSPAAVLSLAHQAEIRIAGDGNVIGNKNQVIVIKGEGLQELARLLRAASETSQALHQLPPPPGDFTGRAKELEELMDAIERGGVTISGLRGMGGIGKTALALKLADKLRERYPDAQIYLDLKGTSEKPLTTAEAMAHIVRSYRPMDKPPENEAQLAALYHSVLDGQRALLLMDNAASAAEMMPLIPPATCILLVTSRQHFALPGLYPKNLEALPPEDARSLLLAIAPRIDGEADAIAKLCGYLPLALRAAGGMLAAREDLPPRHYAEQLRDERQRLERLGEEGVEISVEASFNLSYASLEAGAARVFRQLAVFPGSFDAAADEVVCGDPEHARLSELLRRSLVEYDSAAERYRLHDLTRLFAASRRSDQERADAERRQAARYLEVASAAHDLYLKGGDAILEGLRLFDTEWANIRAGQAWAAGHAEEDEEAAKFCSRYAGGTWHLLDLRLHPREHIRWLEAALAAARQLKDPQAQGVHLGNLGLAHADLGDARRAIEYYEQALPIARKIGDRRGEAVHLGNLGIAYGHLGEPHRAVQYFEQALAIDHEIRDRRGEASALGNLGIAYRQLGEPRRAIRYFEQALAIGREIGDRHGEAQGLGNLGLAYTDLGDPRRATQYFEQALTIHRELGGRRGEGATLGNLGVAYRRLGDPRRAIECYEKCLVIAREIGDRRGEGADLGNLGNVYADLGEPGRGIECFQKHLAIARETGDRRGEGTALGNLGSAYSALGDPRRAVQYHGQYLAIAQETNDRRGEGNALWNMSLALDQLGDRPHAIANAQAALKIYVEIEDPWAEKVRRQLAEWGA
jgi:tetratricopeptide (TPR) repeat protein